ncbi:MAG: superoxide dismutase [Saprospiraceae bacterium]|nr:superoxide dismutase [Saprospiraceae bacterium]
MQKRTFLKTGVLLGIAAASSSFWAACKSAAKTTAAAPVLPPPKTRRSNPFTLPPLPYDAAALEPHIDKMTMEIHHGKHHQAYVNNLNDAVKDTVYADYELEDILFRITTADADKKIRNNGGGHWNHTFFWQSLSPAASAGAPSGNLATSINTAFGSLDQLKEQFNNAAKGVFGSGWAWLCVGKDKSLFVTTTPNQDNPLMLQVASKTGTPILGLDVWEHAYYLKYQNKRPDYVAAFWNLVNWKEVGMRYEKAMFG